MAPCFVCAQVILVPRFAVEQGLEPNGDPKIRAVDNMSWSACRQTARKRTRKEMKAHSVNGFSQCPEKIQHDHLDMLMLCMKSFMAKSGKVWAACCISVVTVVRCVLSGTRIVEGRHQCSLQESAFEGITQMGRRHHVSV